MSKNRKNEKYDVPKSVFLIGLLIEILIGLIGYLLQAILYDVGLKYLGRILIGIIWIYFLGRNYFFVSASSRILGIVWEESKYILLKNFIYLLIIFLSIQKILILQILASFVLCFDMVFMLIKGKWFLNKCFKIESYVVKK